MKIVFFSNIMNHHQLPLSLELDRLTNGEYTFVATAPFGTVNVAKGYEDLNKKYNFILRTYDNQESMKKALRLADEADVVLFGSAPFEFIKNRKKDDKLIIWYSERIYKKTAAWYKRLYHKINLSHKLLRNKKQYMLCASAYTALDYYRLGLLKDKYYKWGYFPPVIRYDNNQSIINKDRNRILWCGRLIDWKNPMHAIKVAEKLKKENKMFRLDIIGAGPLEEKLRRYTYSNGLDSKISFLGSMNPNEVRKNMESAGIFLFTSNREEGWGAVLNESMNSKCAVIASHEIGSVPFLISNESNGLIYRSNDIDDLYEKVNYLLDNPQIQKELGENAYKTITELWNAEMAAKRLIKLSKNLLEDNTEVPYIEGPCSRAPIIKEDWYNA